eukprot:snap_masked-scaffold_145-processed-gene-0.3-mRNA-1 protein AED:1.00 eAED:1.00 QI:0/0/0/0/1/1/2/0/471
MVKREVSSSTCTFRFLPLLDSEAPIRIRNLTDETLVFYNDQKKTKALGKCSGKSTSTLVPPSAATLVASKSRRFSFYITGSHLKPVRISLRHGFRHSKGNSHIEVSHYDQYVVTVGFPKTLTATDKEMVDSHFKFQATCYIPGLHVDFFGFHEQQRRKMFVLKLRRLLLVAQATRKPSNLNFSCVTYMSSFALTGLDARNEFKTIGKKKKKSSDEDAIATIDDQWSQEILKELKFLVTHDTDPLLLFFCHISLHLGRSSFIKAIVESVGFRLADSEFSINQTSIINALQMISPAFSTNDVECSQPSTGSVGGFLDALDHIWVNQIVLHPLAINFSCSFSPAKTGEMMDILGLDLGSWLKYLAIFAQLKDFHYDLNRFHVKSESLKQVVEKLILRVIKSVAAQSHEILLNPVKRLSNALLRHSEEVTIQELVFFLSEEVIKSNQYGGWKETFEVKMAVASIERWIYNTIKNR